MNLYMIPSLSGIQKVLILYALGDRHGDYDETVSQICATLVVSIKPLDGMKVMRQTVVVDSLERNVVCVYKEEILPDASIIDSNECLIHGALLSAGRSA